MKKTVRRCGFTLRTCSEGFTLIELLIVFAVIAVLTTLTAVNIQGVLSKVHDGARKSDLKELRNSLNLFYNAQGKYPNDDLSQSTRYIFACGGPAYSDCVWGQPWVYNGTVFMNRLPVDSKNYFPYVYSYRKLDDDNIILWAVLENKTDPAAVASQASCAHIFSLPDMIAQGWTNYISITGLDPTQVPLYVVCN